MILEAFSEVLREEYHQGRTAEEILHAWLSAHLDTPAGEENSVGRVLHTEVSRLNLNGETWFTGRSASGNRLLDSLYSYCKSYESWQFSRWLHHIRASDFVPR